MKRLIAATLAFSLAGSASPVQAQQMMECFDGRLCVDFNSFKFVVSKIPAAPKYEISRFKGTRTFSNGKSEAIMEIDCIKEEFRTVKIKEGKRWENFDPRWSPGSDHSLLDMACAERD
jgi:hypothetical protein